MKTTFCSYPYTATMLEFFNGKIYYLCNSANILRRFNLAGVYHFESKFYFSLLKFQELYT